MRLTLASLNWSQAVSWVKMENLRSLLMRSHGKLKRYIGKVKIEKVHCERKLMTTRLRLKDSSLRIEILNRKVWNTTARSASFREEHKSMSWKSRNSNKRRELWKKSWLGSMGNCPIWKWNMNMRSVRRTQSNANLKMHFKEYQRAEKSF